MCLLHNPEYFLSDAAHRGVDDLAALRTTFYERLQRAFAYFESQVAAGRLQSYGVSSNTVTASHDSPEAVSLSDVLDAAAAAARAVGSESHHFRILQCPMNLFESGAALTPNTGPDGRHTVLEYAQEKGIAVLVNRPLNAMPAGGGDILRLAELPFESEPVELGRQLDAVRALEKEYQDTIAPAVQQSGQGMTPAEFFTWAQELERVRPQIRGLEHWEQIEHHMIAPQVNQVLQTLPRYLSGTLSEQWEAWRDRYLPALLTLLRGFRREATERSRTRTQAVAAALDPLLPPPRGGESLSRKVLWILASTPGVTCVLNGMRTPQYVNDALEVLRWEPLKDVRPMYEKAKSIAFH